MSRAKDLKKRADSVLEDVFRALFEEIDTDKLKKEVDELRASTPDYSQSGHARVLTRRTAIRCAAAGAVTGLPLGLVAIATVGVDLAYLMHQQLRLILGIATIYGHEPSQRERFAEAMSCLAYVGGVGAGKQGIAALMIKERATRMIPFVGAISGGALNYVSVQAVARSAIRYYESRIDDSLADEIWSDGDRDHA
ncbi:MAG TPA: hypothetical protein VEU30_05760 [Thermoanaerobaculia bacterium]|nr:hypothetical protein [Thermoanaerobaculia bacterium]